MGCKIHGLLWDNASKESEVLEIYIEKKKKRSNSNTQSAGFSGDEKIHRDLADVSNKTEKMNVSSFSTVTVNNLKGSLSAQASRMVLILLKSVIASAQVQKD